jgi:cell division protein FtsN
MPDSSGGLVYRVQVGAFLLTGNARRAFDRLQNAGFRPAVELNGGYYRVVIPGVKAADMSGVIDRLGSAGFREAWLREEF